MSAEVSQREVGKQVTNSSSTTSGVARCFHTATFRRDSEGLETRSDGAAGKAAYHKYYCSSRAEHQALAVWKFLGRTPT